MTVSADRPARSTRARTLTMIGCGTITVTLVAGAFAAQPATGPDRASSRSLIENETPLAVRPAGPRSGGGDTTAFPFFSSAPELKTAFRKRVLHPGSSIGCHRPEVDEIYHYQLSGKLD